ncbi:MAG: hypothetical protein Q8K82_00280 [Gemmatimonadaceae bacterium]|nr:hypothetical protein [Gemmatimonadaceae bacterium]
MIGRSFLARVAAALFALVQAFAPGVASVADARPAATALSERAIVHFEAPGTNHDVAHPDHCALCSVATHDLATPSAPPALLAESEATWPPREKWLARYQGVTRWSGHSRAPPA